MNKKELMAALQEYPDDAEIILQKDGEGNWYSPLEGIDSGWYFAENTWSGEFIGESSTAEDNCQSDVEYNEMKLTPKSIVLFPVA